MVEIFVVFSSRRVVAGTCFALFLFGNVAYSLTVVGTYSGYSGHVQALNGVTLFIVINDLLVYNV